MVASIVNVDAETQFERDPYLCHLDFPLSAGMSRVLRTYELLVCPDSPGLPRSLPGADSNR